MTLSSGFGLAPLGGHRRSLRLGGALWLTAGFLQLLAMTPFLVPTSQGWFLPGWQFIFWFAGGFLLLTATIVLVRGHSIVGPSPIAKSAMSISACAGLLTVATSFIGLVIGGSSSTQITAGLLLAQLFIFAATSVSAAALVRARILIGTARWTFIPVAGIDGIAAALIATQPISYAVCALVIRPALIAATGLLLLREEAFPQTHP